LVVANGPWWKRRRSIVAGAAVGVVLVAVSVTLAIALSDSEPRNTATSRDRSNPTGAVDGTSRHTSTTAAHASTTTDPSLSDPSTDLTSPSSGGTLPSGVTASSVAGPSGGTVASTRPDTRPGSPTSRPPVTRPTVTDTVDPATVDIDAAYKAGFYGECQALWSHATADGKLFDADDDLTADPYYIDDCLTEYDPDQAWWYDTPAEAREGGVEDADSAAEFMTLGDVFRNSNDVIFDIP
jgi:hypothetical protein